MAEPLDLSGKRFGSLVAVSRTNRTLTSGRKMSAWVMKCDCGGEVIAMTVNLTKGKHQSCGCRRYTLAKETTGDLGVASLPEYRVYHQMLDRCYLPTAPNYNWYGAKGVTVCDEWRFGEDGRTGFLCFYADMGPRPEGMTLDREDPRGPYSKENCRWATWETQGQNRREHHLSEAQRAGLSKLRAIRMRWKCTDDVIMDIRTRLDRGQTQMSIEAETGVSQATISRIKLRQYIPISEMGVYP